MKNQKPFFKNAFKNLLRNKIQLITIIVLVFLTSFVFTLSYSSTSRIEKSYENFISEKNSNIHDFIIDLSKSSYVKDFEKDLFSKNISDSDVRDNMVITYLQNKLFDTDLAFDFDRVESRISNLSSEKTLKVFALNPDQKVDKFVVNKGMSIELWKQYTQATNINTKKWVYVNEEFAKANNIKINDIIRIKDDEYGGSIRVEDSETKKVDLSLYKNIDINSWIGNTKYSSKQWFQVVGFGSTADFSTPVIDETKPLPNTKQEGLIYIDPSNLGLKNVYYESIYPENIFKIDNPETQKIWYTDSELKNNEVISSTSSLDKEVSFVAKFKSRQNIKNSTEMINEYLTNLEKAGEISLYAGYENTLNKSVPIALQRGDARYPFYARTTMLGSTIKGYKLFSYIVMLVTIIIGIVMLVIMLNNQIKKSFGQSGVLLSLGYKKSQLIWSNGLYPLFISVIGGFAGYILGMVMQEMVISIFSNFFSFKLKAFEISWESMLITIFGMFILLEIITLITYFYMFNKFTPLQMINFESRSSTNKFKLAVKSILARSKKFNNRFRGAILSGSILKLVSVFSVMLVSSTLISIGAIMPSVLADNKKSTYIKEGYNNQIEYQSPIYNSPTSFYKTYNPYSDVDKLDINDSATNIWNMYLQNNVSQKIYNPSTDVGALNDMTYKSIDMNYLKNKDLYLDLGEINDIPTKNNYYKTVIFNLWPDLKNYGLDKYWNKQQMLSVISSNSKSNEYIDELEKLRQFYLKYRDSVGIQDAIAREGYYLPNNKNTLSITGGSVKDGKPMISHEDFRKVFVPGSGYSPPTVRIANSGKINGDEPMEKSLYEYRDENEDWTQSRVTVMVPIYNWIMAFMFNNLQQAFLQGIYSQSPSMIKTIIEREYQKEDGNFNTTFGLIPYNKEKEDIGIFLNAYTNDQSLKIYGIKEDNKTQIVKDSKGKDLKNNLFESENLILINQSLAKRLNLKPGDKVNMTHIINELSYGNEPLNIKTWDTNGLSAKNEKDDYTSASNFYSSSMMKDNGNGWKNSKINPNEDNRVYKSKIDITSSSLVGATEMSKAIAKGDVATTNSTVDFEYTVAGVVNQYGDNKAWINNDLAEEISKYNESKELLFRLFMKEWSNPNSSEKEIQKLKSYLNNLNSKSSLSNKELFANFENWTKEEGNEIYMTLFESEYPLFNYKSSFDESFTDISKGVSTNQKYGDYSMIGLNGGSDTTTSYPGYSNSSINKAMQIEEALKVMTRINTTANLIIYFVVFVTIFLSAIIILLTINLVISENAKIIAVMKILGYKESYISKLFIGIYVPVAIISSIIGVALAWAIIMLGIHLATPIMVLPLVFKIWYIVPGILGTWLLYTVSNTLSWISLKKVSMLLAVQGG
ncbi:ABC transporter permease [Spiroplasma endosymbiont of Diplazon laetatorius]|uniref:ABC transporter permease n=1 Tax=Spiroplasma endosymbiont of Diplazon laetatorius TaxID=3066322 RepID=UPI0030D4C879